MKVVYRCDGKKPCFWKVTCGLVYDEAPCEHTLDPEHAKNGKCKHPERYPERFEQAECGVWVEI